MSKYDKLWQYIKDNKTGYFELSFDEIGQQAGSDLRQFFFTL